MNKRRLPTFILILLHIFPFVHLLQGDANLIHISPTETNTTDPLINEQENKEDIDHKFWPTDTTYLFLHKKPVPNTIQDFCKMQDISTVLSPQLQRSTQVITQSFEKSYPVQIWERLAKTYGWLWFFDGHVLYVYDASEIQTKIFKIHPQQITPLQNIIHTLGFYGSNIGINPMKEGGILVVSGAQKMIQLLEDIINNLQLYSQQDMDFLDVKVFHLKHAWADDKTIGSLTIPGMATLLDNILGKQTKTSNALTPAPQESSAKQVTSVKETSTIEPFSEEKKQEKKNKQLPFGGNISTDPRQNAIIIKDYHSNLPLYDDIIAQLDVPLELIEIQAAIVNVSKGCGLNVGQQGIEIKTPHHTGLLKYTPNSNGESSKGSSMTTTINGVVDGIQFLNTINILESQNLSKLLARPSVITMDNLTAIMDQSSTRYLSVKGNKDGDLYSIKTSISLKVTPHLFEQDGHHCIQLILDIKDESISPTSKETGNTDTTSSSISTQAVVYEGQSVLVGGYFDESYKYNSEGVPILKDIPVLGHLFKNSGKSKETAERLFLITPRIIHLSYGQDPHQGMFQTPSTLLKPSERIPAEKIIAPSREIPTNTRSHKLFQKR